MKDSEFPLLKVSNIDWDKDHEEFDKLLKILNYNGVRKIGALKMSQNG